MKRIMHIALATATASAFALPALAGNLRAPQPEPEVTPAPVAVAPAPVVGDWTGGYAGVGLGWDQAKSDAHKGTSGIGSVFAGYDYDFGKFVLGGELGANKSHASYGTGTLKTSYDAKVRGGVDLGKTLVYGALGAAHADGVHGVGKLIGVGVDYKLTDRILVGGEADYTQYNNGAGAGNDLKNTTLEARVSFKF